MDVWHTQLIATLSEHGWQVVDRQREDLDWWADEIWTVESQWSPKGMRIYLTWLVDAMWDAPRLQGQQVWPVGTCMENPPGRLEAEGEPLMSIKHWPRGLPDFLEALAALRNQSSHESA
jgi:hypothetical protein